MARSGLLAVLILSVVQGCSSWTQQPLTAGVAPVVSTERPVRVTRANGSMMVLTHPYLAGDSLVGEVGDPPQRAALPLRDIQRVEERRGSAGRTAGVVGAGAGVVVIVTVVVLVATVWLIKLIFGGGS